MTNAERFRILLVTAAGLGISIPADVSGQARTVTLQEAIDLAVRNNPSVIQARGNIRIAEAGRREYYGQWLPTINGTSSASTNSSSRFDPTTQRSVSGNSTSYSAGLSASYTIFDGFRRNANGRTTRANIEAAEATLVTQRFDIILQTKQAYFNAVAADELVTVAHARIERAQGQLKIAREKLDAGTAIRSDTLRSFVELGNARLQELNAVTQRETATANLARIIGADTPIRVRTGQTVLNVALALDTLSLRAEALAASPNVQQSEASARAADADVSSSRAGYFPSLTASYQQNWAGAQVSNLRNTWSARVSLSWPIFNGFTREMGVTRSSINRDIAYAQLEDARRLVNAQFTQFLAALESARLRIEIATASRAAGEEDLRVQQERYRLGASTIVDVLTSQEGLAQAEVDLVQARLDYQVARAQLEALLGREL